MPNAPSEFQSALGGLDASKEKASISEAERLSALRAYGLEKPAMKPQADMLAGVSLLPTGGAAGSSPAPAEVAASPQQPRPKRQKQKKGGITQDKLSEISRRLYEKATFSAVGAIRPYQGISGEDRLRWLKGEQVQGTILPGPSLPRYWTEAAEELNQMDMEAMSGGTIKNRVPLFGFDTSKLDAEELYVLRLLANQRLKEEEAQQAAQASSE